MYECHKLAMSVLDTKWQRIAIKYKNRSISEDNLKATAYADALDCK